MHFMKLLFYPIAIIFLFASCHHQKTIAKADANSSKQTTSTGNQKQDSTSSFNIVHSEGNVQIATDQSTTATIEIYNPPDSIVTITSTAPTHDSTQMIYRVTISFISKGEGIDYKTEQSFENWLKQQPKHPAYETTHWGREGETNFCLKLDELSTREQDQFVKDVRTQLADKQLVFVSEHAVCKGVKDQ